MAVVESEALTTDVEERHPRRPIEFMDVLCVGPIIAHFIYGYAGYPLNALIGTHPVLLSALRGSTISIVTAGAFARVGRASLALALIAPLPYTVGVNLLYFWAGRRYGRRLFDYLIKNDPRWRKRLARGERLFARFGFVAVLLAPTASVDLIVALLVGEARMRFVTFLVADVVGNQIANSLTLALGWVIGQPAVTVAEAVSHYALWFLIGSLVLAFGWAFWSAWRAQRNAVDAT
jgi:membrane protein DedA with SNARE-associated domain